MVTRRSIITHTLLLVASIQLTAQQATPYKPSREEVMASYKRAALLDSAVRNKVFRSTIHPNWQASGDGFWYMNTLAGGEREYYYVDAVRGRKQPAFSREKLIAGLSKATGKPVADEQRKL